MGRRKLLQGPQQSNEALQGIEGYEQMVNTFSEQAKGYWRMWGPLGEPMVQGVDAWAAMQGAYIRWLRQTYGAGNHP